MVHGPLTRSPLTRGLFITFEGGDGLGKTTQISALARRLLGVGKAPLLTREPGGTPEGERLRPLLLKENPDLRWTPLAELFLMMASRAQHWERVIEPALAAGRWVLCDRFMDSSLAYQGGGVPWSVIHTLHGFILGDRKPDVTFIFLGQKGLTQRGQAPTDETHFENKGPAFQAGVQEAYRRILACDPARCVLIEADQPLEVVEAQIWRHIQERAL